MPSARISPSLLTILCHRSCRARLLSTSPRLRHGEQSAASSSFKNHPSPPRLPKEEQEIFERLQKSSSSSFSSTSGTSSAQSAGEHGENDGHETSSTSPSATQTSQVRVNDQELLHPDARRGAKPEFEGDVNPKTGEVGGPKNDPLRWGPSSEWTYNGRATDF